MTDRAYERISIDTKESGSIVKQRSRISADVLSKGGDPEAIVHYADEGVSASKFGFAERPAGARLLSDLRAGDRVIFTRIDRAARSVRDLLNLIERIESAGASVRIVDNELDTAGPYGRFMLVIFAALAELEAAITAERRMESLASFRAEGRHAQGKAPYGFMTIDNPETGRGRVLMPNPETAPILREAIDLVMTGTSQNQARALTGLTATAFNNLLRNPRLAGMTPHKGGVYMEGDSPRVNPDAAILTVTDWHELLSMLTDVGKGWSKTDTLADAYSCGVCSERLYFHAKKGRPAESTYQCLKKSHAPGEPGLGVVVPNADLYVSERFLTWFGDHAEIVVKVVSDDGAKREALSVAHVTIAEIERQISEAGSREERRALMDRLEDAYDARDAAQGMVTSETTHSHSTGRTVREAWEAATDSERAGMVKARGTFYVRPGRMPIDQRIVWVPRGMEDQWSADAEFTWQEGQTGQSLTDISAGIVVQN